MLSFKNIPVSTGRYICSAKLLKAIIKSSSFFSIIYKRIVTHFHTPNTWDTVTGYVASNKNVKFYITRIKQTEIHINKIDK